LTRPLGTLTRPFCSIYDRHLSQKICFSKPIRRLKPIERPAEEARTQASFLPNFRHLDPGCRLLTIRFSKLVYSNAAQWLALTRIHSGKIFAAHLFLYGVESGTVFTSISFSSSQFVIFQNV
jgi:hypothetical protein